MYKPAIFAIALMLGACASTGDRGYADALHTAAEDDDYCNLAGFKYPAQGYVDCRMRLDNSRIYRQWRSMEVMQQSASPGIAMTPPSTPSERFIPLDPEHYRCWPDPQFGSNYIMCGESGK
jgi:hypothetical protein